MLCNMFAYCIHAKPLQIVSKITIYKYLQKNDNVYVIRKKWDSQQNDAL